MTIYFFSKWASPASYTAVDVDPSIHLVNNQCFVSAHEFDLAVKPNDLAKDLIQRIHEETGLTEKEKVGLWEYSRPEIDSRTWNGCQNLTRINPDQKEQQRGTDRFAPIRKVWDIFIEAYGIHYIPHEFLTVDEQLLAFHGRCLFHMYIPNKPAKYGIKIVMVNDVKSKYMLSGIPYLGKQWTRAIDRQKLGHSFTKDLTQHYHNTNRNVTTDNWFTSVPLIKDMLYNCGMTLIGTVRGNKSEIPEEMKDKTTWAPGSSAFLFTKVMTLVSYVPNTPSSKKIDLLMSSMHGDKSLASSGKPTIINRMKGGVDIFDQMCGQYSCGRKTKRWPLCVFYGMLNTGDHQLLDHLWGKYAKDRWQTDKEEAVYAVVG
ncbi:unnamed protein product [Acanthosepion pharaonis]|uniref:PiggyBac transposable element-derived protein domain-containing protein n=1 Tax=Acanthosepion pharaonis TaxID=158019 RepID=A0A812CYH4_ACAPH|nr:unnamed protein product [Sepia pharaonis]